jgi:hypothetical protein
VEVKIGIENSARELTVDTDSSRADVEAAIKAALGDGTVIELTDTKGRAVLVPGAKVTYVEIGSGTAGQVGFRS